MTEESIIHNGYFEYKKGKPYGVYSYAIADFEEAGAVLFHLYLAFLKLPFCDGNFGNNEGERIVNQVIPAKDQQTRMNDTLKKLKQVNIWVAPRDIYEGVDLNQIAYGSHDQNICRLKNDMPFVFDEDDIVFQIARYDTVSVRKWSDADDLTDMRKQIESKFEELKKVEMEKCGEPEYYKSRYTSLKKLVDNWLDGHIYIKDLNSFLGDSYKFMLQDEDMKPLKAIDMYSKNFYAALKEREENTPGFIGDTRIEDDCTFRIINSCDNEHAIEKKLNYYVKNKDYLAKWVVMMIKGRDITELERKSELKIMCWDINMYLLRYMQKQGFDIDGYIDGYNKASCYDPVNNIDTDDAYEIVIPYEAIRRFRETGNLLSFDEEMIEKERKRYANRRLWGRGEINSITVDYDPTNYKVVGIDVRYEV